MQSKILLLGASDYYTPSILKIQAMGIKVIAMDQNPNVSGLSAADVGIAQDFSSRKNVLKTAQDNGVDGILPLNDFGVEPASFAASRLGLARIPHTAAKLATDKGKMRLAWQGKAYNPPFHLVNSYAECRDAAKLLSLPVILKPSDSRGGGSRGISVVRSINELKEAYSFATAFYDSSQVIIEKYVEGLEHSAECIIWDGQCNIIAMSDKKKTPLPYRVDKDVIYPSIHWDSHQDSVKDTLQDAIAQLGITHGIVHAEFCTNKNGITLYEIGARCGGGHTPSIICEWVSGIDEIAEAARIALGRPPSVLKPKRKWGCVYRFLTPRPGPIQSVKGIMEVQNWPGILACASFLQNGDQVQKVQVGSQRSGFLIAAASTRDEALLLADQAEGKITFN